MSRSSSAERRRLSSASRRPSSIVYVLLVGVSSLQCVTSSAALHCQFRSDEGSEAGGRWSKQRSTQALHPSAIAVCDVGNVEARLLPAALRRLTVSLAHTLHTVRFTSRISSPDRAFFGTQ